MNSYIEEAKKNDIDYKNEESTLKQTIKVKPLNPLNPLNIQLLTKYYFNKKFIKINKDRYTINIKSVHELTNNRIGILTNFYLLIYSLNSFKLINKIEPDFKLIIFDKKKRPYYYPLFDFIGLKNNDLAIWNSKIIFFYNLKSKECYQTINEYNQGKDKSECEIKTVCGLSNGILVSCTSQGLKIYHKKNKEYNLKLKLDCYKYFKYCEKVVEIKPNILILFAKEFYIRRCCAGMGTDFFNYSFFIYDAEKEIMREFKFYNDLQGYIGEEDINHFLIKNNYLLIRYGYHIDIFKISKNMELIKSEKNFKSQINFLCDYYDDLFFSENSLRVKIYKFEDEKILFFNDFPLHIEGIKGMFKLKNNLLVMYSKNEIQVLNSKK